MTGEDVRKSVQTIVSQRQSLTESQVLNAIADVIMQDIGGSQDGRSTTSQRNGQLTQSVERQIGEEVLLEKINQIFDDVAREQIEESYIGLAGKQIKGGSSSDKTDKLSASIQVHE